MTCLPGTPVCVPTPGGIVNDGLDNLAQKIVEAIVPVVKQVGTLWVSTPTPQIATDPVSGKASSTAAFIQGSLWWYMAAALVLAVIVGGTRMAWEQRGEPLRDLLKALLTFVVVSSAGLSVIALGTAAGDAYAKWVIDTSTDGTDFASNIAKMLGFLAKSSAATPGPANPVIFVIIAGFLALLFSCFQIVLMVVRGGMLVVLAGVFPLTAAFTNTETGRAWFRKACGWILAFILYKPAAAIIYATSFRLVGDAQLGTGGGITTALTGVTLMLLALVALPALMRFVVPMVSAIGGGSGGGGAALGAAAMALPSGAISAGGRGTASGSGASGGRSAGGQGSTGGSAGGGTSASGSQLAGAGARAGGSAAGAGVGAGAAAGAGSAAAGAAGGPVGVAVGVAVTGAKQAGQAASSAVTAAATQPAGGPSSSSAGGAGTSSGGTTGTSKPNAGSGSAGSAATGSAATGSADAPSGGQAAGSGHSGPVGSAGTGSGGKASSGAGGWSTRDTARGVAQTGRAAAQDVSDMTGEEEGPRGSR